MFWNKYPYSNLHDLNLDWIINEIKKVDIKLQNISKEIIEAVDAWLVAHPEATTTVQDGSLTRQKFTKSLQDSITWINGVNKDFTPVTVKLGNIHHSGILQAMASDGTYLYAISTTGDTEHPVLYKLDPADLTLIDSDILAVYGHPNSMDYCDGYLYIAGTEQTPTTATYKYVTKVKVSNFTSVTYELPHNLKLWSMCLMQAYNGKRVIAGHRPYTSIIELYATIYAGSSAELGQNKFMPWQCLNVGPFSCDPADMTQCDKYLLIGDAHLNGSYANNAVRMFDSMGGHKATIYIPEMENRELEGVCVIGNAMYTCDGSGNIYRTSISEVFANSYDPGVFGNNDAAGVQFVYVNENGSEVYDQSGNAYLLTSFRLMPFYQPSGQRITNGLLKIKTYLNDVIVLKPNQDASGNLIFTGTGQAGRAIASYYLRYDVSTPADNDEYMYTLTGLQVLVHYNGEETIYTTFADAATAGYFTGYTYIENLISEASVKYSNTPIQFV